MEFLQAASLDEALGLKAEYPGAVPIAGGTDVMVEINFDARRPEALLDLTRVAELTTWAPASADRGAGLSAIGSGSHLRIGAGVSYVRLISELGPLLPGLAMAARTVGSPQIRNRGTIGGNLGAASPAGDCHPMLLASGAVIEAASLRGTRQIPAAEFYVGPKRNALQPDELITAVLLPRTPGPQQFAKIGTRNAMVIAVCAFALELRPPPPKPPSRLPHPPHPTARDSMAPTIPLNGPKPAGRDMDGAIERLESGVDGVLVGSVGSVGTGIGSAGPTPLRATAAEEFLAGELAGRWADPVPLPDAVTREFGALVAQAARPIDDVRGTAAYRRHALSVLARRTLTWAWAAGFRGDGSPRWDEYAAGASGEERCG
jgi:CO/xanthine dehydrogenase FAD-binding subunit